jgi:hypothetical protein
MSVLSAKLGIIIESRYVHSAFEYKPKVLNFEEITVGRVILSKEMFDRAEKHVKLDDFLGKESSISTFSFTRNALFVLERIAVTVD